MGTTGEAVSITPVEFAEILDLVLTQLDGKIPVIAGTGSASARQKNWQPADELEKELRQLFDILMIETNPIPVKWSLFEMGLVGPHIRLPMTGLDDEYHDQLRQCFVSLDLMTSLC